MDGSMKAYTGVLVKVDAEVRRNVCRKWLERGGGFEESEEDEGDKEDTSKLIAHFIHDAHHGGEDVKKMHDSFHEDFIRPTERLNWLRVVQTDEEGNDMFDKKGEPVYLKHPKTGLVVYKYKRLERQLTEPDDFRTEARTTQKTKKQLVEVRVEHCVVFTPQQPLIH